MFFGQTANVTAEITDIAANIAEEQVDQKLRGYSSRDEIELDDDSARAWESDCGSPALSPTEGVLTFLNTHLNF